MVKPYIEFNTQKRIEAQKNSDKDGKALYKLMNNAVYGKSMDNLRNRIDVRIYTRFKGCIRYIFASLFFKSRQEYLSD